MKKRALLLVDVILAFFATGGLPVPSAEEILAFLNKLMIEGDEDGPFDLIIASFEQHLPGNKYLASTYGLPPFTKKVIDGVEVILWDDHAMDGTVQVMFHPNLKKEYIQFCFRKGYDVNEHPFSMFEGYLMEDGVQLPMKVAEFLREHGITDVTVVGLAYDFCAGDTAYDSAREGFTTRILKAGCRSISLEGEVEMDEKLRDAGVEIIEEVA